MPSTKPHAQRPARGLRATGRCIARAITRLFRAYMDCIHAIGAALVGRDDVDLDRRVPPHVATLGALGALGWHVTEIQPDHDAPVLWRVEIKRYDGAVAILMIDAADPDAALEELARYAAADAEDPQ